MLPGGVPDGVPDGCEDGDGCCVEVSGSSSFCADGDGGSKDFSLELLSDGVGASALSCVDLASTKNLFVEIYHQSFLATDYYVYTMLININMIF